MFFFSSRRRHTRYWRDWSSDVCSSDLLSRRAFLTRSTTGLGALALSSLLNPRLLGAEVEGGFKSKGALKTLHSPARAKRVIYMFQSDAPSHLDLFASKPKLKEMTGDELP